MGLPGRTRAALALSGPDGVNEPARVFQAPVDLLPEAFRPMWARWSIDEALRVSVSSTSHRPTRQIACTVLRCVGPKCAYTGLTIAEFILGRSPAVSVARRWLRVASQPAAR